MSTKFQEYIDRKIAQYGNKFDTSDLNKEFISFFNNQYRIEVQFPYSIKRGRVGVTTGWKPCFILMLTIRSIGSQYILDNDSHYIRTIKERKMDLKTIKSISTVSDFQSNGLDPSYEISYRGGTFGFSSDTVSALFNIPETYLPRNNGVYCNYLGGGLRGSVTKSTYSDRITGPKKTRLNAFLEACYRAYINIEKEQGLIDETDENGETNWENAATNASRKAGIVSAY